MGDVVKFKRPSARAGADGKTLCRSGFHKWKIVAERRFDVKRGKLLTLERCVRCGEERTKSV